MTRVGYPLVESPWGAEIGLYFVVMGIATGLSLIFWWIRPQNEYAADAFEWTAAWVAMTALSVAGVLLIADLGRPWRFWLMLTELKNPGSPMAVGARLLAAKGFLLGVYIYLLHRRRQARRAGDWTLSPGRTAWTYRVTPALLGVVSLALAVYPAILLSRTWTSPLAASPAASFIFLVTALLMGTATALLVALFAHGAVDEERRARLRRMLVLLLSVEAMLLLFEGWSLSGHQPTLDRIFHEITSGRTARTFGILVVLVGTAGPLAGLLLAPRRRLALLASAAAVLVGAGATRVLMFALR